MTELIDMLAKEADDHNSAEVVFDLAAIRATAHRCIDLHPGLLAVRVEDDILVSFAVFSFHSGPSTRNGAVVAGEKMELVFHGCGPSGALRELRHTHWGDKGYVFYPSGKLIANAFTALAEWFDCD